MIVLDTGVLYAAYNRRDRHHLDSVALMVHALEGRWGEPWTTRYIEAETLALAKARLPARTVKAVARLFMEGAVNVWVPGREEHRDIRRLFTRYLAVRTLTLADASLLYFAAGRAVLATFDNNLARLHRGRVVGSGYWEQLPGSEKARIARLAGLGGAGLGED